MNNNFVKSTEFLAKWEWRGQLDGAPTNHPRDPGGFTRFGISKKGNPDIDVENLTLENALKLYYNRYWMVCNCDSIEMPLALCVYNAAVMSGPRRALGILEDVKDWKEYLNNYKIFLFNLNRPDFIKGWTNRLNDLRKWCEIYELDNPKEK